MQLQPIVFRKHVYRSPNGDTAIKEKHWDFERENENYYEHMDACTFSEENISEVCEQMYAGDFFNVMEAAKFIFVHRN